jgi:hypothetical protein
MTDDVRRHQARNYLKAAAKLVEFAEDSWPNAGADKIKTDIEQLAAKIKQETKPK